MTFFRVFRVFRCLAIELNSFKNSFTLAKEISCVESLETVVSVELLVERNYYFAARSSSNKRIRFFNSSTEGNLSAKLVTAPPEV